jgi:parvulin-like peptidyl-prolyl isomerase
MSKSGQTNRLPKEKQSPEAQATNARQQQKLIREYRSKAEREATIQRYLIISMIILAVVVGVLVGVAFLVDQVITPRQVAATVNNEEITVGEFEREVRLTRALRNYELNSLIAQYQSFGIPDDQITQFLTSQPPYSTWINELQVPDQLGNTVLNTMIEDELVLQRAEELGITVNDADIEAAINEFFGFNPEALINTPTPTPTSTITPTPVVSPTPSPTQPPTATLEFTMTPTVSPVPSSTAEPTLNATEVTERYNTTRSDVFAQIRSSASLSDADIHAYFELQALRTALREQATTDMGETAPFVNARVIVVGTQDEANDIVAALQNGESFAALAQANSMHESSANSGDLGWVPLESFGTNFSAAAQTALEATAVGGITEPILTDAQTYAIFQVRAREDRDLDEQQFESQRDDLFAQYLDELRNSAAVEMFDTWTNNVPEDPPFLVSGLS